LAIHAPAGSVVQVSSSSSDDDETISHTPQQHQLLVSSVGATHPHPMNDHDGNPRRPRRSSQNPKQVYMLPHKGPPKPLLDHSMVRLLLPPPHSNGVVPDHSDCAVLQRDESASKFF
jgi:hypothetical protein